MDMSLNWQGNNLDSSKVDFSTLEIDIENASLEDVQTYLQTLHEKLKMLKKQEEEFVQHSNLLPDNDQEADEINLEIK